jgi:hypothetical protein
MPVGVADPYPHTEKLDVVGVAVLAEVSTTVTSCVHIPPSA